MMLSSPSLCRRLGEESLTCRTAAATARVQQLPKLPRQASSGCREGRTHLAPCLALGLGAAAGVVRRDQVLQRRARGGYGYGGYDPERARLKQEREDNNFWAARRRGAIPRNDRYWQIEEKRLFSAAHVSKGINFDKYDSIEVETTGGQGTEEPAESFAEVCEKFEVAPQLQKNIELCGYDKPTPVQKYSLPAAMMGTDVMCSAQTGSGKTAAFLVPIVAGAMSADSGPSDDGPVAPRSLVLAPTRELCQQISTEARRLCFRTDLRIAEIYGGAPADVQLKTLAQGCDIAICTPGRLQDFLNRGLMTMEQVKNLTLDEADRMLDMGFEPQIRAIIEEHGMPFPGLEDENRQTTMFSATFPKEMQDMALDFLDPGYLWIGVGRVGTASENVEQRFVDAQLEDKFDALMRSLDEVDGDDGEQAKTLVFVNTRAEVDNIVHQLSGNRVRAAAIHGGLQQRDRDRAVTSLKNGRIQVLVATDVAARGLDLPGIGHVVNYDLPTAAEDYIHRIGRTGRIGNKGVATSLVGNREPSLGDIIRQLDEAEDDVPDWLRGRTSGGRGRY